jgi:hypothetical protein
MLRLILLTSIESGTSTCKSLWSYCLFNCWPSIQVRVIKLIISPWFTTPNKTSALNAEPFKGSAFISVCCQLYCNYPFMVGYSRWPFFWWVSFTKAVNRQHFHKYKINIRNTDVLILDEISMLSAKLFIFVEKSGVLISILEGFK